MFAIGYDDSKPCSLSISLKKAKNKEASWKEPCSLTLETSSCVLVIGAPHTGVCMCARAQYRIGITYMHTCIHATCLVFVPHLIL